MKKNVIDWVLIMLLVLALIKLIVDFSVISVVVLIGVMCVVVIGLATNGNLIK